MKVWIVMHQEYEDVNILGVFSNEKAAQEHVVWVGETSCWHSASQCEIQEHEVHDE